MGNLRGQAGVLSNTGLVYLATRDYTRAVRFVERSLCISRRIGDRVAEMGAINSIGLIHLNAGAPEKALDSFNEMLGIAREIQELRGEANATFNKSLALTDLGDLNTAAMYAESSLQIFEQFNDSHLQSVKDDLSKLRQRI
jgi:tetratricopeptide (TPR) repeat protein